MCGVRPSLTDFIFSHFSNEVLDQTQLAIVDEAEVIFGEAEVVCKEDEDTVVDASEINSDVVVF